MLAFGSVPRPNAMCPNCASLERHRLIWLYLLEMGIETKKLSVLHVAPEPSLQTKLLELSNISCTSVDLNSKIAMLNMDITRMSFPNQSFDVILCSHVLEHIVEDIAAMSELNRVLRSGGFSIMMVPISGRYETHEDPSADTPEKRLKIFGQEDHVRLYGLDYADRLGSVGFKVDSIEYSKKMDRMEFDSYCLNRNETLYVGFKPS